MAVALVDRPPRPDLRLLPGGRSREPSAQVYRRRRAAALALAVTFVVVVTLLAPVVLRPLARVVGGGPLTASDDPAPVPAGAETVVAQPGDTLWSIAHGLRPAGDVRALVDELEGLNGGADVRAGQTLVLPG